MVGQTTVRVREPHCWMNRVGSADRAPRAGGPQNPAPPLAQGEMEWHGRDLHVEAVFIATAITSFRAPVGIPLMIMPVSAR